MNSSHPENRNLSELDKSFEEFLAEEGFQETVDTGATQRVKLDGAVPANPTPRQPRRTPQGQKRSQPAPKKRKAHLSRKDKTTIIALCAVAAVLLIAIIIAISLMAGNSDDDGLIKNNVYVAGVNLGGMTEAQAKAALQEVALDYDQLDMVVEVLDTTVLLTPGNTGANLDVDAAVKAAMEYGRNGDKAQNQSSHTVSIVPYLNLDTDYIRSQVDALGAKYSTLRSDPTYKIKEGTAPSTNVTDYDTEKVWQIMELYIGTAEYDLSADKLYQQILDAYDSNIFEVVAECSVLAPETSVVDVLEQAFAQYCRKPVDASIDENYNVTAEVYGYGFDLDTIKDQVATAAYGTKLDIPMTFIRPDITAEDLAGNLFQDVLGTYVHPVEANDGLIANIKQVLKSLNGMILKAGDEFSFNTLVGEPTRQRGYKPYSQYVGTVYTENVYGGGISQVASVLYYCALQADLEILERHTHAYAPIFIQTGLDADIKYGTMDLRFKNSTTEPIRIVAEYANGQLTIQFLGTDTKEYTFEIIFVTDKIYNPVTLLQTMPEGNSKGYKGGEVLQTGITGYDISVFKHCTYKPVTDENGTIVENPDQLLPFDIPVGQSHYEKRNIVQIDIYVPPVTEPPVTSEPVEDGTSESTDPSESTGATEASDPTGSTEQTESTGSTESNDNAVA